MKTIEQAINDLKEKLIDFGDIEKMSKLLCTSIIERAAENGDTEFKELELTKGEVFFMLLLTIASDLKTLIYVLHRDAKNE